MSAQECLGRVLRRQAGIQTSSKAGELPACLLRRAIRGKQAHVHAVRTVKRKRTWLQYHYKRDGGESGKRRLRSAAIGNVLQCILTISHNHVQGRPRVLPSPTTTCKVGRALNNVHRHIISPPPHYLTPPFLGCDWQGHLGGPIEQPIACRCPCEEIAAVSLPFPSLPFREDDLTWCGVNCEIVKFKFPKAQGSKEKEGAFPFFPPPKPGNATQRLRDFFSQTLRHCQPVCTPQSEHRPRLSAGVCSVVGECSVGALVVLAS